MNNNSSGPEIKEHNIFKQGIDNYQNIKYKEIEKYYLSETIKLSLITGPLYCIAANMQFLNNTNLVNRLIPTKISFMPQNIPKVSLNMPYKPTTFKNYKDCVLNLRRQGIMGFYKGNTFRLIYFTATSELKKILDKTFSPLIKMNRQIKEIILYTSADIILNPLLMLESRYSIQNRRKGFRIYKNISEVITKSWRELYLGSFYSIPRNVVFLISLNTYFLFPNQYFQMFSVFLAHLLSYPILTIQRNKIYHSLHTEYLPRPDSTQSFSKQLVKEFGVMSLYRGFFSYILATSLWHLYVPKMAQTKFYNNALKDNEDDFKINMFEDDEYEDIEDVDTKDK